MKIRYTTVPVLEVSLDELRGLLNPQGESLPYEYSLGAYAEMDTDAIGEKADIQRLLVSGLLSPSEKAAVLRRLADQKLNPAGRKALERGIKRMQQLLLR